MNRDSTHYEGDDCPGGHAKHDQMCDLNSPPNMPGSWGCQCALIARVRADERERAIAGYANAWDEVTGEAFQKVSDFDRLEVVAARLVEIICEQETDAVEAEAYYQDSLSQWLDADLGRLKANRVLRDERDAARVELADLRAQIAADIEADRDALPDEPHIRDIRIGLTRAARIARGGAQ